MREREWEDPTEFLVSGCHDAGANERLPSGVGAWPGGHISCGQAGPDHRQVTNIEPCPRTLHRRLRTITKAILACWRRAIRAAAERGIAETRARRAPGRCNGQPTLRADADSKPSASRLETAEASLARAGQRVRLHESTAPETIATAPLSNAFLAGQSRQDRHHWAVSRRPRHPRPRFPPPLDANAPVHGPLAGLPAAR